MTAMTNIARDALNNLARQDLLEVRAYINGEWVETDEKLAVVDPATGEHIAQVAHCSPVWADRAVEAASAALAGWGQLLPLQRGLILRQWAQLMRKHAQDLAVIMTAEQGKPLAESLGEISYGAAFLDWFAAEGERCYGETIPSHLSGSQLLTKLQPIGVTVAITPWNFPSAMITRKAGAALAAGCTMIVKPAPETPLSALALARLAAEAGMPAGVFQVLTGDAVAQSARLLQFPEVRAFSFTGSTDVGKILLKASSDTVKRVSLELGGHAPFIVFEDASIDDAVAACINAKFATSGQDCLAANRIYVQRDHYDTFVTALAAQVRKLRVGHGLNPDVDIGPMTRRSVAAKCQAQIINAISLGATLVVGGTEINGNFVQPTVLADATDEMDIAQDETFGPVAAVFPFDTEEEVLQRANDSEFALAAYVYTNDLRRALRLSDRLQYGMVAINTPKFTGAPIPFGGWKQSGLGREGSKHGLEEYMEIKYVCFGNL